MVDITVEDSSKEPDTQKQWEISSDKTFKKLVLNRGTGLKCPREGSICTVRVAPHGSTHIDLIKNRSVNVQGLSGDPTEFKIGEGDTELDGMIDKILEHMKPAETSLCSFQIHSEEQTNFSASKPGSNLLPVIPVELKIELISFVEVAELWELNPLQAVEIATSHKERGVDYYKAGQFLYALRRFARAVRYMIVIDREALEKSAKENTDLATLLSTYRTLFAALYSNIAAIQLQSQNYTAVIDNCRKALQFEPNNVKAYYRRGVAYARTQQDSLAKKDLLHALSLAPTDAHIRQEIRLLTAQK